MVDASVQTVEIKQLYSWPYVFSPCVISFIMFVLHEKYNGLLRGDDYLPGIFHMTYLPLIISSNIIGQNLTIYLIILKLCNKKMRATNYVNELILCCNVLLIILFYKDKNLLMISILRLLYHMYRNYSIPVIILDNITISLLNQLTKYPMDHFKPTEGVIRMSYTGLMVISIEIIRYLYLLYSLYTGYQKSKIRNRDTHIALHEVLL